MKCVKKGGHALALYESRLKENPNSFTLSQSRGFETHICI